MHGSGTARRRSSSLKRRGFLIGVNIVSTGPETLPSVADRFAHILSAIDAVQEELHGITEDALANDRMRRLALERLLEIISVASDHIPANHKAVENGVDWQAIATLVRALKTHAIVSRTMFFGRYRKTSLCRSKYSLSATFVNRAEMVTVIPA